MFLFLAVMSIIGAVINFVYNIIHSNVLGIILSVVCGTICAVVFFKLQKMETDIEELKSQNAALRADMNKSANKTKADRAKLTNAEREFSLHSWFVGTCENCLREHIKVEPITFKDEFGEEQTKALCEQCRTKLNGEPTKKDEE